MRRWLATVVIAGAVLSACGTAHSTQTGAPPAPTPVTQAPPTTAAPTTSTLSPGTTAASAAPSSLQFAADVVGGGQLDFRSLAGKPVALWFWAPT